MTPTPWNLTPRQVQVLTALISNGGKSKEAAVLLGIRKRTVDITVARVKQHMEVRTRLDVFLTWDRWVRQQLRQAA